MRLHGALSSISVNLICNMSSFRKILILPFEPTPTEALGDILTYYLSLITFYLLLITYYLSLITYYLLLIISFITPNGKLHCTFPVITVAVVVVIVAVV